MRTSRIVVPILGGVFLSACGTYVPDTQDFPGNQNDQQLLVSAVVQSIHCEVGNAISDLYEKAKQYPDMLPMTKALETWGMQLTLSLKTEEKGALSPAVVWTPPSPATALFSLSGGLTASADAIRTDKIYFYYLIKDLKQYRCPTGVQPRGPVSSPLIQNSLKFHDYLFDVLLPVGNGEINLPTNPAEALSTNVLYYEVSFEIINSGNLTPAWTFTRVVVNPAGTTFASALRDRTHDLQITMGPGNTIGLTGPAQTAQLSGDIGLSVANSVRTLTGR
ncbi:MULTISPECIES: hypothetical protein [unclassified Bradyrhizobium]|uniref:hypothetical protein n=1 Tax=unclassified Bradyrhizobium TaxID=2631580 RepID=UPI002305909B|nr:MULTISPECIES: hypothetical protein [unclassified Bradyrhizobium]MDA9406501.1 hypothetical protein [Bradyrhizobium sp. CCBAU 45384]MDA9444050.1 hypothetical protein [Bradyrhizobium sp. CCBAU 51745]